MSDARNDVDGLRLRPAVRALIVTPAHEILLVHFVFPTRSAWALPGGGIDPGESPEAALRRELREEVGHELEVIGPHVWNRLHVIPFENGLWDGQRDQVHLIEVPARFEPQPVFTWEQLNDEHVHEMRWWHLDEIASAVDVLFMPAELAAVVRRILDEGPPNSPFDVGV